MKAFVRFFFALALTAIPLSGMAQQGYNNVSVYRVVKIRILPGKTAEFYKSFAWAPKIFEAEKAAGIMMDYKIFHSVNYEGTDKWDVMYVVQFKNMAVLDTNQNLAAPIVAKVYGTPEKQAEVVRLRDESSETVSSELVREIQLTPMK
jgi:hypothetical protein